MAVIGEKEEGEEEVEFSKMGATLASIESLTFPLVQEVVLLADFRCKRCQDRLTDIVSRLNGDAECVEISVMEKSVKVSFTRRYPRVIKIPKKKLQVDAIYKSSVNKFSLGKWLFRSSCN